MTMNNCIQVSNTAPMTAVESESYFSSFKFKGPGLYESVSDGDGTHTVIAWPIDRDRSKLLGRYPLPNELWDKNFTKTERFMFICYDGDESLVSVVLQLLLKAPYIK